MKHALCDTVPVEVIEERTCSFLEREERRLTEVTVPIVETVTTENIGRAVETAHVCKDMSVITGDAGMGKTAVIKRDRRKAVSLRLSTG
jgi:DNA transposition AAA+ family ATPase